MRTGEPITGIEVNGQRADGTNAERVWMTYWHPLKAEDGSILGINVAAEEITEQNRAKAALQLANESLEARTIELTSSLEELRDTQDRLVQTKKLASLGQLTAGIAHEIKNPLNFVNNFSSLSIELAVELQEAIKSQEFNDEKRTEIRDLLGMLQGNLGKIVHHGKRADSIVKNMLLHSRQVSGEHRSVDLNALVEESLNLAYHGAKAQKGDFSITLERLFDPTTGEVNLLPEEITRVLLNLISNSFYATTQRKAEANGDCYEPILTAATKNLGDCVEIRIRDNGTGMPPEVTEKMFNPFLQPSPPAKEPGWACPSVTTLSSNNIRGPLRWTHSPANSPISGLFCRATSKSNALLDRSDRGAGDCCRHSGACHLNLAIPLWGAPFAPIAGMRTGATIARLCQAL
jgi:signal transduction histidine kinase